MILIVFDIGKKVERIGVIDGIEICFFYNVYCEGIFIVYGDIIFKKS